MNIDIKKLDKIKSIYEKIKVIDSELINLDSKAKEIIDNQCDFKLHLEIENKTLKEDEVNKVIIDPDGSLNIGNNSNSPFGSFRFLYYGTSSEPEKGSNSCNLFKLSNKSPKVARAIRAYYEKLGYRVIDSFGDNIIHW